MFYPQNLYAEGFTSADVLAWSEEGQNSYFNTSISMIGILATRTGSHGEIATCLNTWYWNDEGSDPAKNALIRNVMKNLPDHHPQAVILAVVEKYCGSFKSG